MDEKPTKEMFLDDVKNHKKMIILRDDGLYRHIIYKQPKSNNMYFEIITWPGYLAYTGDMGSFMFSRLEDMFQFFRTKDLEINTGYWAEKVKAESMFGNGIREFNVDEFKDNILLFVKEQLDLDEKSKIPDKIMDELEYLLSSEDEWECVSAVRDFESEEIDFTDFWEINNYRKTYYFVWCCYAITWAVSEYDKFKSN